MPDDSQRIKQGLQTMRGALDRQKETGKISGLDEDAAHVAMEVQALLLESLERSSRRLEKLTWGLMVLTVVLAGLAIADLVIRL